MTRPAEPRRVAAAHEATRQKGGDGRDVLLTDRAPRADETSLAPAAVAALPPQGDGTTPAADAPGAPPATTEEVAP